MGRVVGDGVGTAGGGDIDEAEARGIGEHALDDREQIDGDDIVVGVGDVDQPLVPLDGALTLVAALVVGEALAIAEAARRGVASETGDLLGRRIPVVDERQEDLAITGGGAAGDQPAELGLVVVERRLQPGIPKDIDVVVAHIGRR